MYNPSEPGQKGTIFGLPYKKEEADLILLPIHLDVTVSYNDGTAKAPDVILEESSQGPTSVGISAYIIHGSIPMKGPIKIQSCILVGVHFSSMLCFHSSYPPTETASAHPNANAMK